MSDSQKKQEKGKVATINAAQTPGGGGEVKPKAPAKTPRQRFLAECDRRVNQLLKAMSRVGRMGNRKQYESTDPEMRAIIELIKSKANRMIAQLWGEKDEQEGFSLSALLSTNGMPPPA